jgi:hypothetical protein
MNYLKDFRATTEERLAAEFPNSNINVVAVSIADSRGIYVYEVIACFNDGIYRGTGDSIGKAIDRLLFDIKHEKYYHELHD